MTLHRLTKKKLALLSLSIFALTLCLFHRSLLQPFCAVDDFANIFEHQRFANITPQSFTTFWKNSFRGMYIPISYNTWAALSWLSKAFNHGLVQPSWLRSANLTLHAVNATLLFLLAYRGTGHVLAAAFGAGFFALHPMQVEPVVWISGLREILAGTFGLLALHMFTYSIKKSMPTPGTLRFTDIWQTEFAASLLLLIMASLAKVTAMAFFPLMLLWPLILGYHYDKKVVIGTLAMIAAALAPFLFETVGIQPPPDYLEFTLWKRLFVAGDALQFYVSKIIYPNFLVIDYGRTPMWLFQQPHWPWSILSMVILLVLGIFLARTKQWTYFFLLSAFVTMLLPALGLIPFSLQKTSTVADRMVYFSLIVIGLTLANAMTQARRQSSWYLALGILLTMSWCTWRQISHWENTTTLFTHTQKHVPHSIWARSILAPKLSKDLSNLAEVEDYFRQAIRDFPHATFFTDDLEKIANAKAKSEGFKVRRL